jgi:hypothetical protein
LNLRIILSCETPASRGQAAPKQTLGTLLMIAALGSAGCTDESEPQTGAPGESPAVMVVGQAFTPEEYLTYVRAFPDVPEGDVDFSEFREFGNANAYTYGGYVFVDEDGQVKRFSVGENYELIDGPILSWQNYGIASTNASYAVFVSPHRAYTFAPELGVVLVWDPELMELSGTLELDLPGRPADMETWAYDGRLVGDKVVWNVFSGNFDAIRQYPAVTLALADADTDEPVRFLEDERCLGGGPSNLDAEGNYFVQGGAYYGYFYAYGDGYDARTCTLRMNDGEVELDPGYTLDYEELTGSPVTDLWLPAGEDSYIVRAWDAEQAFPEDPDEFWDNQALHSLLVNTQTGAVEPYPALEGQVAIDGVARVVDGVSYYQLNEAGYVEGGEVDVFELHPGGIRKKFHLSGFLLGLDRIR